MVLTIYTVPHFSEWTQGQDKIREFILEVGSIVFPEHYLTPPYPLPSPVQKQRIF